MIPRPSSPLLHHALLTRPSVAPWARTGRLLSPPWATPPAPRILRALHRSCMNAGRREKVVVQPALPASIR
ncbi:hypothetical protein DSL92_06150 [Billgrantia gudaonensis]|uniref:Uncharacterized protein n=1 Tax=Billgrantia gudaonensis TaxID=376427 RepID=A0A432JIY2_9GAMM|nr:hypothetical protein DSL92_06150 [Halomonas gudaonensis]